MISGGSGDSGDSSDNSKDGCVSSVSRAVGLYLTLFTVDCDSASSGLFETTISQCLRLGGGGYVGSGESFWLGRIESGESGVRGGDVVSICWFSRASMSIMLSSSTAVSLCVAVNV